MLSPFLFPLWKLPIPVPLFNIFVSSLISELSHPVIEDIIKPFEFIGEKVAFFKEGLNPILITKDM